MNACKKCGGHGFIESEMRYGGMWYPKFEQCPKQCNIANYTLEVQKRLSGSARVMEKGDLLLNPADSNTLVALTQSYIAVPPKRNGNVIPFTPWPNDGIARGPAVIIPFPRAKANTGH